ncbi:uncharacterized protein CFAP92 [Perognathus longimembris pacificus]|uniref:uncharacterized protein CFAP92 n=1 Tax=Perognathus longimembris pacificus TaxID=214514 RepID=UPI002019875A|nr:uncharacterized protein CFAP92 [Perognathus longimembris pacificus]
MSLQAWEWEDEDPGNMEPISSLASFYQSLSDRDMEEYLRAKARAQESDSDDHFSMDSSVKTASTFDSDVPQVVPCKFVISLALPANANQKGKYTNFTDKYKKHLKLDNRTSKARRFYHIEYVLLPDDGELKKIDLVVFPGVAKVFLDSVVKTVKPWREGNKIWVSWSQSFNVNMTKELLKKINFHKITLRLWDTKDKVSKKVRYYRLKAGGYSEDTGSFGKSEVRKLVLNQKKMSETDTERVSTIREKEHLPGSKEKAEKHSQSQQGSHQADTEISSKNSEEYEKSLKTDDLSPFRRSTSRTTTSLAGTATLDIKELIERTSLSSLTNISEKHKSQLKGKDSEWKRKYPQKGKKSRAEDDIEAKLAEAWEQSTFSLQLAVMPLLAGWHTVVSRGSEKSANILDCFLSLETEVPIMTEEQKQDLNPLTIKIKCASCLPSQPVPMQDLERLCEPVYCRYQFYKTPVHKTKGEQHGTHVYFQDINVIFLGAIHPSDLREYLQGPPMVVEVHDRDWKSEEYSHKLTPFGENPLDPYINLQTLISSTETENNPFTSQNKAWDPYGVAQVSFADLLLGHKYLNLVVPIHNCEPKGTSHSQAIRSRKSVGSQVPTDVLQVSPMPMGNYLEANSLLKLRVDVAVPLSVGVKASEADLTATRFGRIVFVFDSGKRILLQNLLQDITVINAKALELDLYPTETIQQILSAFKMRVKVQDKQDMDLLTGFHLMDGKVHLLILEGLADQGLKQLWEKHQSRSAPSEHGACKVLYNSKLLFSHRLYADLETILYHVHLFKPLSLLMRHPALYVRNTVPRRAFLALARIYDICHNSTKLREVIVRDLLPSSAMIKDLSQEFGMPISQEELTGGTLLTTVPLSTSNTECTQRQTSTLICKIRAHKEKYLQWRNAMLLKNKGQKNSLIQKNITEVSQVKKPPKVTVKMIRISPLANKAVYNYSIQTLNSAELAKKEMYKEMAKEPGRRFTYSQNYLSAIVEPQDSEEEKKKAQKKSRQAWLTANGFQVLGLQSDTESHHHDLSLPPIGGLNEEWKASELFANVLKPVLDRDRWSWEQRHLDFDLYKKPPAFLELPPGVVSKSMAGKTAPF